MRQWVIRAINTVLFSGSCFVAAGATNQFAADALVEPSTYAAPPTETERTASPTWEARAPIIDRNLFGARISGGEEPVEVVDEELEETKLPLTLLATIAAFGPDGSRAAIHDNKTRLSEVRRPGETLESHPGVKVDRIERGRVLLMNKGRREELTLAEAETVVGMSRPPPRPEPRRRPSRRSVSSATSAKHEAMREQLNEISQLATSGEIDADEIQERMQALKGLRGR